MPSTSAPSEAGGADVPVAGLRGRYYDGCHARRHEVEVRLLETDLEVCDLEGRSLARWPFETLRSLDEGRHRDGLRITSEVQPEARLILIDPPGAEAVIGRAPALTRRRNWSRAAGIVAGGILGAVLTVLLILYGLPRMTTFAAEAIPVAWEERLGENAYRQMIDFMAHLNDEGPGVCAEPAGVAALEGLTAGLAQAFENPYAFRVSVLDFKMTNAFALPGGRIVLFRGLIEKAGGSAEVAGVLAHEMGHVMNRDGTKGLFHQLGLSLLLGLFLGDVGGGSFGEVGQTVLQSAHSREAEASADRFALEVLEKRQVSARGMVDFFTRLQEEHGELSGPWRLIATHPSHEARERLFAAAPPGGGPALDPLSWQALRRICGAPEPAGDEIQG